MMKFDLSASVVMTTYNGLKYIHEQLESLRKQSFKPSEVIIYDDCSTDGTYERIVEYIGEHSLSNWKIKKNSQNIGWKKNFHKVINESTSDIVFFSDQDDIWEIDKLKIMMNILSTRDEIEVLSCRCSYIDQDGEKKNVDRKELPFGVRLGDGGIHKVEFDTKYIYSIMPGCTMAVRQRLIAKLQNNLVVELPHDALYWKMGILLNSTYYIDKGFVEYRIHDSNVSQPLTGRHYVKKAEIRCSENNNYYSEINIIKRLYSDFDEHDNNTIRQLDALIDFCDWRRKLINREQMINTVFRVPKYLKYYRSYRMFFGDIMASINR